MNISTYYVLEGEAEVSGALTELLRTGKKTLCGFKGLLSDRKITKNSFLTSLQRAVIFTLLVGWHATSFPISALPQRTACNSIGG
jgi:hypothetical protein